jgi:hypothetical protein
MNSLPIHFSLIGAGILSLFPLSAQAQLVINSTQNAAINGDNNQITQVINQTIIYQNRGSNFSRPRNMNQHNFGRNDDDRRGGRNGHSDERERERHRGGQKDRD